MNKMSVLSLPNRRVSPLVPVKVNGDPFSRFDSYFLLADYNPFVVAPVALDFLGEKIFYFGIEKQDVSRIVAKEVLEIPNGRYSSFGVSGSCIFSSKDQAEIWDSLLKLHQYDRSRIPFKKMSILSR